MLERREENADMFWGKRNGDGCAIRRHTNEALSHSVTQSTEGPLRPAGAGLQYKIIEVDLTNRERRKPEYLADLCGLPNPTLRLAILIYENEADFSARTHKDRREQYWAAWRGYSAALTAAGVTRSGAALQSEGTGTTVRMNANARQVQDGPYADMVERRPRGLQARDCFSRGRRDWRFSVRSTGWRVRTIPG
jgi:hypothetical protein